MKRFLHTHWPLLALVAFVAAVTAFAPGYAVAAPLVAFAIPGMVLDEFGEFCDAEALNTGAAASYLIGDVIDTGGDGLNDVDDLYLVISVDTAVTSGGAGTYGFALCSDAQAAIAVDGSQTTHFATAQIAKATLVAGYIIAKVELPKGTYERYIGIVQTTAVAAATAGKVNAFLTNNPRTYKAFPDASN